MSYTCPTCGSVQGCWGPNIFNLPLNAPNPPTADSGAVAFVPGVMHCAKCKFRLMRTNLHAADGKFCAGDNKTEPCPNGCGPLWPVTWEQEARECWARLEKLAATPATEAVIATDGRGERHRLTDPELIAVARAAGWPMTPAAEANLDLHDDLPTVDLLVEAERIAKNQYKDGRYAAALVLRILCHRLSAALSQQQQVAT